MWHIHMPTYKSCSPWLMAYDFMPRGSWEGHRVEISWQLTLTDLCHKCTNLKGWTKIQGKSDKIAIHHSSKQKLLQNLDLIWTWRKTYHFQPSSLSAFTNPPSRGEPTDPQHLPRHRSATSSSWRWMANWCFNSAVSNSLASLVWRGVAVWSCPYKEHVALHLVGNF